ncbi:MAG TPA: DUF2007 domain-containing protein [Acidobacteriaceae bacterium]|nr:DUF2007 domain-containing protein [Acidobacteriaceae bacterium]
MTEEPELVTVGKYGETFQAELAKGRLEAAGIRSFLVGENTAMLYGTGLGGLQLQVSPEDEVDARTILEDPGTTDADVEAAAQDGSEESTA